MKIIISKQEESKHTNKIHIILSSAAASCQKVFKILIFIYLVINSEFFQTHDYQHCEKPSVNVLIDWSGKHNLKSIKLERNIQIDRNVAQHSKVSITHLD